MDVRLRRVSAFVAGALVLALGVRALHLAILYLSGAGPRYRVESAATIFVVVALAVRAGRSRSTGTMTAAGAPLPLWTLAGWWLLAGALYGRALSIGLLSDDYVLVEHARRWEVGAVSTDIFRPLALSLWAVLLHAGGGATGLHLFNILLHGTNAFLTTRLVAPWFRHRLAHLLAGGLVLTSPLAAEAVAWASGVFDVMATTLVLACVLASRRYGEGMPAWRRPLFVGLAAAALMSKETAVVAVALVALDAWVRRAWTRPLLRDAAVVLACSAAFAGVRLMGASELVRRPISRFTVQRFLFNELGSLAVPWHLDVVRSMLWLPMAGVIVVIALTIRFCTTAGTADRTRVAAMGLAWVVCGALPLLPFFYVAPDLQGSRYLYLPAVGWAALLVVMAGDERGEMRTAASVVAAGALVILVVAGAVGTSWHLHNWQRAAVLRDAIESAARGDARITACGDVGLNGLPDNSGGAYVFRNGVAEAFARDVGLKASVGATVAGCSFQWDAARGAFSPAAK